MEKGIYTLVLHLAADQDLKIGSLGKVHFEAGYYAYTGSARGPGGLARVERHMRVMEGKSSVQRWHIDRLLPLSTLVEVVATKTEEDLECLIAKKIGERLAFVEKFGCTDCRCPSHLHFSWDREEILLTVKSAHAWASLSSSESNEKVPAEGRRREDQ
jgi:Uri superfamily endonuclease